MSGRLYGLDALRGVAAIAVAVHHFARINHLSLPLNPFLAVDLFFILSGFVMARTYEERLRNGLTTVRFIGLRYRRLFMPLAVGSTIGLGLKLAIYGPSLDLAAAYVLILGFLPAVWLTAAFLLNTPAWSLFVEIVCNVLHGAVFAKVSNMQITVLAVAAALVFIACYTTGFSVWGSKITSILWLIPRELTCYLVGIWVCRTYGDAPLGKSPALAVGAFAIALCLASISPFLEMLALIACPFIVRASLGLPRMQWAIWTGALSYPLYATHAPVMQAAQVFGLYPALGLILVAAVAVAVTIAFEARRPRRSIGAALSQNAG